jgi:hypothetical protein
LFMEHLILLQGAGHEPRLIIDRAPYASSLQRLCLQRRLDPLKLFCKPLDSWLPVLRLSFVQLVNPFLFPIALQLLRLFFKLRRQS